MGERQVCEQSCEEGEVPAGTQVLVHQRELRCLWESRANVQDLGGLRKESFEE